jgi:nucleotide-binding universal stress UspA family protein
VKWIVGIDLGERSIGALRMAAWLQHHARGVDRLVGVHALDQRVRTMMTEQRAQQIIEATGAALEAQVAQLGVSDSFSELRTVLAHTPEEALAEAATTIGVDGVVVGRIARSDSAVPWRLGSVARRLLRRLPAPVMVVPPDLVEVGSGPVLLATDLHDDSAAAAQLALRISRELGRGLLVAHVDLALVASTSAIGYGLAVPLEMKPRTIDDVERWIGAQRLGSASATLLEGDVVERLLHCAGRVRAPLLVCGSRQLGLGERIFSSSVASELAARAGTAVVAVPPTR